MQSNNYAIIMAGGIGSRFWPWSTTQRPKQFLDVLGTGKTLIQQTYERINRICPTENILIITNQLYEETIAEQLPQIPRDNILSEPSRRNTAPCIAFGAFKIQKINPEANILVAPADHIILKEDLFVTIVEKGFEFTANNEALLTIGIEPHKPETGYGYIQSSEEILEEKPDQWQMGKVTQFREKPDLDTAKEFVASGNFYWNAGIFIWSAKAILTAFEKYTPKLHRQFAEHDQSFNSSKEGQAIEEIYSRCDNISIDYAVMEKADNVFVISTDIGWSDLGNWSALHEISKTDEAGNAANGDQIIIHNSKNTLVKANIGKVTVVDGLEGYIVVDDEKALLICKKENEQNIKQFVNEVKEKFGEDYV